MATSEARIVKTAATRKCTKRNPQIIPYDRRNNHTQKAPSHGPERGAKQDGRDENAAWTGSTQRLRGLRTCSRCRPRPARKPPQSGWRGPRFFALSQSILSTPPRRLAQLLSQSIPGVLLTKPSLTKDYPSSHFSLRTDGPPLTFFILLPSGVAFGQAIRIPWTVRGQQYQRFVCIIITDLQYSLYCATFSDSNLFITTSCGEISRPSTRPSWHPALMVINDV